MNLSQAGVHLIAGFEGFRPDWYDDGTGVQTIGYGHTGGLPSGFTAPLSVQEGLRLLSLDAASAARAVAAAVKVSLGLIPGYRQARFDALTSFTFNVGAAAFTGSHVLKLINEKGAPRDWTPVATAMLAWDHAGGKVLPGLLRRRQIEGRIVISGRYPTGV